MECWHCSSFELSMLVGMCLRCLARGSETRAQHAVAVVKTASLRREPLPAMSQSPSPASISSGAAGRAPSAWRVALASAGMPKQGAGGVAPGLQHRINTCAASGQRVWMTGRASRLLAKRPRSAFVGCCLDDRAARGAGTLRVQGEDIYSPSRKARENMAGAKGSPLFKDAVMPSVS